jgi:hypothetical protein
MKKCKKCDQTKNCDKFELFSSNNKKYLRNICKECRDVKRRERYVKNQKEISKKTVIWKRRKKFELNFKIKNRPCSDCNRSFPPWMMEFDHRDPKFKVNNISSLAKTGTITEKLKEEIKKCDLLCVICHRYRTQLQLQKIETMKQEYEKIMGNWKKGGEEF